MNAATPSPRTHSKSLGFSMIELMVALTVGLLLIGGMVATLVASSTTGKTRERASEIQNNGRYALDIMRRDLQHAGFMGYTGKVEPSFDVPLDIAVTNKCDLVQFGQLTQRIWGAEKTTGKLQCISVGDLVKDTDTVLVRHLGQTPVADADLKAGVIYYRSSYEGFAGFLGGNIPANYAAKLWTPPANYPYEETIYYISKFTTSKNESPNIPALWRVKLTEGPEMVPELVASGVEDMQIRYKERIALGKTPAESTYAWVPANKVADWSLIVAVEVSLLVRGSSAETNLQNVREYKLGDETVKVPDDGIPRQVFTTVVYLRNS